MGRKIRSGGKFPCRYKCGIVYHSKSGRAHHERTIHGAVWTKQAADTPDENNEVSTQETNNNQFVEIKEVKFMVKKVKPKESEDEYECGKCGETFSEMKKFCPNCGCEFE